MCQGRLVTLEDTASGARTDEPRSTVPTPSYSRYVAIGDSWTEGVGDPDPTRPNGVRGWADRVAEALAADREDFRYANLAIRGRTVEEILDEQLAPALDLKPDLLTIQGAGNDLLHVRVDIDELVGSIDAAVAKANDIGSRVVLFTHGTPAAGPFRILRGRVAIFNELLEKSSTRVTPSWSTTGDSGRHGTRATGTWTASTSHRSATTSPPCTC